jgi:hypothetical protein
MSERLHLGEAIRLVREQNGFGPEITDEKVAGMMVTQWTEMSLAVRAVRCAVRESLPRPLRRFMHVEPATVAHPEAARLARKVPDR